MHPVILSASRLRSSSACGCCVSSAATAIASSSSGSVEARSVFPERSASIALLRTILISHVIGPATEASTPPALFHTFMESLLQHLFGALPAVQYTERDAQQMRAGGAVHLLERGAIPQRDARQQGGKGFGGQHGEAIERA